MKGTEVLERLERGIPHSSVWEPMSYESYGFRGEVPSEVKRVLYAVTYSSDVLREAQDCGADMLFLHHPFYPVDFCFPSFMAHTPLDCCSGGLNDFWRDALGLENSVNLIDNLGWTGTFKEPIPFSKLVGKVEGLAGGIEGQVRGKGLVTKVTVCSGLGGMVAAHVPFDSVYVTGELVQRASDIPGRGVIEMGHTKSERPGARLVQKLLPGVTVLTASLQSDKWSGEVFRGRD